MGVTNCGIQTKWAPRETLATGWVKLEESNNWILDVNRKKI